MAQVSVIVPLFNQGKYMRDAVESVLEQTYQNLEIIIVDDHSLDYSFEIALGFRKRYGEKVKVLRNKKNCGVSFSRNRGVRNSKGEYLAFLDADDFWFPMKVEKQFNLLKRNSQWGLIHTGVITVADESAKKWLKSGDERSVTSIDHWDRAFNSFCEKARHFSKNDYFFSLLQSNGICTSSVMVRREIFMKAGGFAIGLPFQVEDWLQWLKISMISKIAPINEKLTGYRFHTQSHTAKNFLKRDVDFSEIRKHLRQICEAHNPQLFRALLDRGTKV